MMKLKEYTMRVAAAVVLLGAMIFASCDNGSGNLTPTEDEIAPYLIGKWKRVMWNGSSEYTDDRSVMTFDEGGQGYASFAYDLTDSTRALYSGSMTYALAGNRIVCKLNGYVQDSIVNPVLFINDSIMNTQTLDSNGKVTSYSIYSKIDVDYTDSILGTWQGVYEDDEDSVDFRLNFLAGEEIEYYTMNADSSWVKLPYEDTGYVLDGDWLVMKYTYGGVVNCNFWDVLWIRDDRMKLSSYTLQNGKKKSVGIIVKKVKQ